jgi:hypothetical protein
MAQTLTVFPTGKPQQYLNVSNITVEGGVLTFYRTVDGGSGSKKVTTNAPFVIEEDVP